MSAHCKVLLSRSIPTEWMLHLHFSHLKFSPLSRACTKTNFNQLGMHANHWVVEVTGFGYRKPDDLIGRAKEYRYSLLQLVINVMPHIIARKTLC